MYALAQCGLSEDTQIFARTVVQQKVAAFKRYAGQESGLSLAALTQYCKEELVPQKQVTTAILRRFLQDPLYSAEGAMTLSGFVW